MRDSIERGFTLLEVLVALAILSIAMTAITQALSGSIRNLSHVQQRAYASQVAQNVMEKSQADLLRSRTGQETFGRREWYWRIENEVQSIPNLEGAIGQIEWTRVEVYADEARKNQLTDLVSVGP